MVKLEELEKLEARRDVLCFLQELRNLACVEKRVQSSIGCADELRRKF